MEDRPALIVCLFGLLGLMYIGLGTPLFLRRVSPNSWYGFRTPKTMSDENIWYLANRGAGMDLMIAGAALTVGVVILFLLRISYLPSLPTAAWSFGLFIGTLLAALLHSFWSLSRL